MHRVVDKPFVWLPPLSRDGWLLFATCGVRTFAYGFVSVMLGLYLAALGLAPPAIGGIFTAAMAGAAVMTIVVTQVADRVGRRQFLMLGAILMALSGAVFALTREPFLLIVAAIFGTISPAGRDSGPFRALEQAILPQATSDEQRTHAFAAYNVVGSFAGALGALAVGLPDAIGLEALAGYRALMWVYASAGLLLLVLFWGLSSAAEVSRGKAGRLVGRSWLGIHRSRSKVAKLAALCALDSFGTGFVIQGLMAYWLSLRFEVDPVSLGAIFFGANVFTAISFLAAPALARRIGLLNTMVFTHLPSNVLLLLVPLMPTLELAVVVLLVRQLLSQLDVPTGQSYTMAIVEPDERTAAAGLIAVARNSAIAVAPSFAGLTLAVPALGLPFLIAGSLKIVYDLAIFAVFRSVRPPEETAPKVEGAQSPHVEMKALASEGGEI